MYATAPISRDLLRSQPVSWWAALSVGAAAIHFAVIPDHLEEWWAFGLFFAALGWFQAAWPIAYLERPSRRLAWIAIVVNLATVALWAWSRTAGLPVGPEPGMPEAVGAADVIATVLELALAVGLLGVRAAAAAPSAGRSQPAPRDHSVRAMDLAIWALVAVLSTAAIALGTG